MKAYAVAMDRLAPSAGFSVEPGPMRSGKEEADWMRAAEKQASDPFFKVESLLVTDASPTCAVVR